MLCNKINNTNTFKHYIFRDDSSMFMYEPIEKKENIAFGDYFFECKIKFNGKILKYNHMFICWSLLKLK